MASDLGEGGIDILKQLVAEHKGKSAATPSSAPIATPCRAPCPSPVEPEPSREKLDQFWSKFKSPRADREVPGGSGSTMDVATTLSLELGDDDVAMELVGGTGGTGPAPTAVDPSPSVTPAEPEPVEPTPVDPPQEEPVLEGQGEPAAMEVTTPATTTLESPEPNLVVESSPEAEVWVDNQLGDPSLYPSPATSPTAPSPSPGVLDAEKTGVVAVEKSEPLPAPALREKKFLIGMGYSAEQVDTALWSTNGDFFNALDLLEKQQAPPLDQVIAESRPKKMHDFDKMDKNEVDHKMESAKDDQTMKTDDDLAGVQAALRRANTIDLRPPVAKQPPVPSQPPLPDQPPHTGPAQPLPASEASEQVQSQPPQAAAEGEVPAEKIQPGAVSHGGLSNSIRAVKARFHRNVRNSALMAVARLRRCR